MADLPDERALIQVQETQFKFAVSESLFQKVGSMMNFLANRFVETKSLQGDGPYNAVTPPFYGVDGFKFYKYDAEIVDVWLSVEDQTGLTGGFTEIDVEYQATPGGGWASIFGTRPRIQYNAINDAYVHVGSVLANTTAPVLSVTSIPAGSALRANITAVPTGTLNPSTCGFTVQIDTRPE